MRKVFVIGIGAGDPEQVTLQAIRAMNRVDAFFVVDKGTVAAELAQLRKEICERYVPERPYRVVEVPPRDPYDAMADVLESTLQLDSRHLPVLATPLNPGPPAWLA